MGWKRVLKRAALAAARVAIRPDPATRRIVFCYHSVHPNRGFASTTPEAFERHVQWLKAHCRVVTLADVVAKPNTRSSGTPLVAITFDDGYEDNHSYALPILSKHGVPATFFITAGLVDKDPTVLRRLQWLWGCGPDDVVPLDWQQVRELRASGMDIGSHTYSHPNLARLSALETEHELRRSTDIISDQLGAAVDMFAYPFGKPFVHFTPTTTDVVRAHGYRMAAAVTFRGVRDSDSVFTIPRFFTDGDDVTKLDAKIAGLYDVIGWWQDHAPLSVKRLVSPDDFTR
jgi:peptidoglycan/xylan/chitin deacetylase (PgdA/CDA1 family)